MAAWKEIVDYTVPSNTTSVTLNNFGTITKDDFIKVTMSIVSNSTNPQKYGLYPNANTTETNYYHQRLIAENSNVIAVRENRQYIGVLDEITSIYISTLIKVSENNKFNLFSNFTATSSNVRNAFAYQTSTIDFNNITSLLLNTSISNGIGAGSRIQIYKLTAKKVADITVTSNTTQVDITELDIKKGDEYLLVYSLNNLGSYSRYNLFVNNLEAENNYNVQRITGADTSFFSSRHSRATFADIGNGMNVGYVHIKLSNTGAYTFQSYNNYRSSAESIHVINWFGSSLSENIQEIESLKIIAISASAIQTNSRFELYKLYEGGN